MIIENDALEVTVMPQVGGTITAIRHKATGLSVLGEVPWHTVEAPLGSLAARDEPEWLTRYSGGWPLLFPNGGDACLFDGVFHGFHGEASIAPWEAEVTSEGLILSRQFVCLPVQMRRTLSLAGDTLRVDEDITYAGAVPADVIWAHHPTFGRDLLAQAFEVTCGARDVKAEPQFDSPANPLVPGAAAHWPRVPAKQGLADLAHPQPPWASLTYLSNFNSPWAAIRRLDNRIAVRLSWDWARLPCAWLWYELAGTAETPWKGRTHLIGIEPSTTPCALGLAESARRGAPLLRLMPGSKTTAAINLRVFEPSGPILD